MTDTAEDKLAVEDTPSWLFMVFKTNAADTDYNYDMNIQITLSSVITDAGLEAAVCDESGSELARASFTDGIVDLTVPGLFIQGASGRKTMSVTYYYNGLPVSLDNLPAAVGPDTTARVTVWGTIFSN